MEEFSPGDWVKLKYIKEEGKVKGVEPNGTVWVILKGNVRVCVLAKWLTKVEE